MTTVSVCVGSSCHLKGSYNIINLLKEAVEKNQLDEKVEVKAAFCLGKCQNGVSMKVDDEIVTGVNTENFSEIFEKYILSKVK